MAWETVDRGDYERRLVDARAALGEVDFGAAWAAGLALTPEQAVTEALASAEFEAPAAGTTRPSSPPLSIAQSA